MSLEDWAARPEKKLHLYFIHGPVLEIFVTWSLPRFHQMKNCFLFTTVEGRHYLMYKSL